LTFNTRILIQELVGLIWIVIAIFGLRYQFPNFRASLNTLRYWKNIPDAPHGVMLIARNTWDHNQGRTIAVTINFFIGIAFGISPFLYTIPKTPAVVAAAVIGYIISFGLFANEIILVNISRKEFYNRKKLSNLISPEGVPAVSNHVSIPHV